MRYRFFGSSKDGTEQEIDHQLRAGDQWYVPFDTGQAVRQGYDQELYEFCAPNELRFLHCLTKDDLRR